MEYAYIFFAIVGAIVCTAFSGFMVLCVVVSCVQWLRDWLREARKYRASLYCRECQKELGDGDNCIGVTTDRVSLWLCAHCASDNPEAFEATRILEQCAGRHYKGGCKKAGVA